MIDTLRLVVEEAQQGKRLDEFLALRLSGVSRMRITRLIADRGCLVNGEVAVSGRRMSSGETVEVLPFEFVPSSMTPQALPLEIAFEDEHLIVVVKPSGFLVHPTIGAKIGTIANALTYHLNRDYFNRRPERVLPANVDETSFQAMRSGHVNFMDADEPMVRPGIVHRLDRATSGLLVVAKTAHALSVVSRHFRKGLVRKKYLALVRGAMEDGEGTIEAPIGRYQDRRPHWWIMDSGRRAETRWRVLFRVDGATLIELEPVTGRTNQLRIHCAWVGHPIFGDKLYDPELRDGHDSGGPSIEYGGSSTARELGAPAWDPGRLFLHAWRVGIHHPETGEWKEFVSQPPAELLDYLRQMAVGSSQEAIASLDSALSERLVDREPAQYKESGGEDIEDNLADF